VRKRVAGGSARLASLCVACGLWAAAAAAQEVILHLRNGDRVAGRILSEDATNVVLSTGWIARLPVPVAAIERRETVSAPSAQTNAPAQPQPAPTPPETAKPKTVAPQTPAPTAAPARAGAPETAAATRPAPPKRWKAQVSLGTDLQFGARDRELFYGRAKLTYELPYARNPRRFFRGIADYSVDYGRTDGTKSTDRMFGSLKTDFDVGERVFVYNLFGAGYDSVRKIDLQYEVGPGAGYRLFTKPKFALNLEAGATYQAQERSGSPSVRQFYGRLAEDFTWKLHPRVTWIEKAEWFPSFEEAGEFRLRVESSLSFGLWQNLALKFSVLDLYDTKPARGVNPNEVLVRSSLEITF
jgi:putative salt-induced outer membrane protein YdiY